MRIKAAVVFVILLVVLLPLMSMYMVGDGTLLGRLQTFVSYGLSLTSMLLSLFTIVVSTYTVTSEIDQRQIYTLVTKPVTRFQMLAGKLIGVLVVDAVLLVLFAGSIYLMAVNIPRFVGAVSMEDEMKVQTQFLTARTSLYPVIDSVQIEREVEESYARLVKSDPTLRDIPPQRAKEQLRRQKELEKRAVAPGGQLVWNFANVKPLGEDELIFVRFKYEVSVETGDSTVLGRWYFGTYTKDESGARITRPIYAVERNDAARTVHEIALPASVVGLDGNFSIVFQSATSNIPTIVFPLEDGFQVLYRSGTFQGNFLRGSIVLYARLAFLALLGVSLATWLSFPVAILSGLVVVFTASISGFIAESISDTPGLAGYLYLPVEGLLLLLPKFDKYNPSSYLVSARMLTWALVLQVLVAMVFIKGLILWLFGVYVFNRREVAKVVV